ncbi:DUF6094 domain-containing protein [Pseudomonas syringae]|uniref:Plasmid related protein n=2 Tax=Pseudomonas syringae TaxID=317 RepID=A0A1X4BKU2_PSESF|nr:DUF6094 domain-containing protein [Pseudomonas syringae]APP99937.1 methyltransferase [Pseudomonas syringae pv. actinidiae]ASD54172.1 Plasmid related protein [Pseudomonas syringae pv. actinidiae]OKS63270.1 SAM-dependent methyltransferase [Pseudomonas syringae pv. actinidiae]OSO27863.1 hypothetical protein BV361_05210 [Pseudomonas syringae pv. actinidiae]
MALMFSRLARNFARNGYYPTDELTLERTLQALLPAASGRMRILDPCSGEGVALAEVAHRLERDRTETYAVEYDKERADHSKTLLDRVLQGDLMDTMISRQSFGLLWLNPPYGDLVADHSGASQYQGSGRKRLEKAFYQRSLPLLQYGGVMVFIVPYYVLDDELCGWLTNHFTGLRICAAVDRTFKQVVIFGIRVRRQDLASPREVAAMREHLRAIGSGEEAADLLPATWPWEQYAVLPIANDLEHFYRITLEPEQFSEEVLRLRGLWPDFTLHFGQTGAQPRAPVKALSRWHLALALAAGAITGVVTSRSGRVLVLKGDTYKDKVPKTEFTEDEDGNVFETRILTDRFVPRIRAWDMTPGSSYLGYALTISSDATTPATHETTSNTAASSQNASIELGRVMVTHSVQSLLQNSSLDVRQYLRRHATGDWGEISNDDWDSNQQALSADGRLFSGYDIDAEDETRLWIITESDRSATTVMLPSDY